MYPSVRQSLIRKAITFYSTGLPKNTRKTIEECLEMIEFWMQSCLITFDRRYYEYSGGEEKLDKGFTIDVYESAFLTDLVASFLLKKTEKNFENIKYHRIYRDDRFVAFNRKISFTKMQEWLSNFQKLINKITEGTFLKFTMEIWKPPKEDERAKNTFTKRTKRTFPFLDIEISWSKKRNSSFWAYAKPTQQIQYIDKQSTHRRSCLNSIPNRVLKQLLRLTLKDSNHVSNQRIEELYPGHIEALKEAKLIPNQDIPEIPMMRNLWSKDKRGKEEKSNKGNKEHDQRNVYLVIGFSKFCSSLLEPLHKTINKININNLPWLCVHMTYQIFWNLGEILQADLMTKFQRDLKSLDFMDRQCNCTPTSLVNGKGV